MAEAATGFLEQLKSCIVWSWTYLWTVWFFIVLFLVYILRVPLKINDNLSTGRSKRVLMGLIWLFFIPVVLTLPVMKASVFLERLLNPELLLGSCRWCRPPSLLKEAEDTITIRQPGARASKGPTVRL
ncbi:hypothetical protein H8959_008007 [Pygathrix nigripes]